MCGGGGGGGGSENGVGRRSRWEWEDSEGLSGEEDVGQDGLSLWAGTSVAHTSGRFV